MTLMPHPGSAAALIAEHGIEAVRGVPLQETVGDTAAGPVFYVSNQLIDKILAEAAQDEDLKGNTRGYWRERLYGGATPDAEMVNWIYPNATAPAPQGLDVEGPAMPAFAHQPPLPGCLPSPNMILNGDGFYVSYNDVDGAIYGCDTTALVLGQMQHFYILNGDHRAQYAKLVAQGFDACLAYFTDTIDQINERSERPTGTEPPAP